MHDVRFILSKLCKFSAVKLITRTVLKTDSGSERKWSSSYRIPHNGPL